MGTPAYMAPEQMMDARTVDSRADIYSLGVVFYEMLTGRRPRANDTVFQLMAKAMAGVPIPDVRRLRPEVSEPLAKLVNDMCAMRAEERIATPAEIVAALARPIMFGSGPGGARNAPDSEGRSGGWPWRSWIAEIYDRVRSALC